MFWTKYKDAFIESENVGWKDNFVPTLRAKSAVYSAASARRNKGAEMHLTYFRGTRVSVAAQYSSAQKHDQTTSKPFI